MHKKCSHLPHWREKIAHWFGENTQFGVPSQTSAGDVLYPYSLHSLLPYETYDPEERIFYNKTSLGFILEAAPLTGADEASVQILASILADVLPTGADLQCLLWASDKIGHAIDRFAQERAQAGDIYHWLAQRRADFLRHGSHHSLCSQGSFILRDFKLYWVVSMPAHQATAHILQQLREDISSSLHSIHMPHRDIPIEQFLSLMTDLLHPSSQVYPAQCSWNEYESLALQMGDSECQHIVEPTRLLFNNLEERWDIRCFHAHSFPSPMHQGLMAENLGQLFNTSLQIPCPFIISFHVRPLDHEKSTAIAQMQYMNKDATLRSPLAKFKPGIAKEHR